MTFESVDLHIPEPVIRAKGVPLSLGTRAENFFANLTNHTKNIFRFVLGLYTTPLVFRC